MSQKKSRSRKPTPPSRGSSSILWIGIWGFVLAVFLGIYTLVTKQGLAFSIISFILAALSIPLTFLQIAPNTIKLASQTLKEGLGILGIVLIIGSLGLNIYLLSRSPSVPSSPSTITHSSQVPPTPTNTSLAATASPTEKPCGQSISSSQTEQVVIDVKNECVGVLDANSGDINNGQWHIGANQGGLIALPPGHYSIIFTAGEIFFLPAPIANEQFCQRYQEDIASGNALNPKNVSLLSKWHPCKN